MGGEGEAWHVCIHRCLEGGSNSGDDSILLPTLGEEQEAVNRSSFCRFVLQTIARHFMRFKGAKYSPIEDWFREGFVDLRQGAHQVLKGHKYLGKSWTLISKLAKHYQTWGIHWWDELLLNEISLHFWSCSSRPWNSWDTCPVVVSTPANRHQLAPVSKLTPNLNYLSLTMNWTLGVSVRNFIMSAFKKPQPTMKRIWWISVYKFI